MLVKYSDVHHATHLLLCLFSKQQPNDNQLFPLIVNLYGKQSRQIRDGCSVNSVRRDGKQHSHAVHLPYTFRPLLHSFCTNCALRRLLSQTQRTSRRPSSATTAMRRTKRCLAKRQLFSMTRHSFFQLELRLFNFRISSNFTFQFFGILTIISFCV